jgi:hypothetical protein
MINFAYFWEAACEGPVSEASHKVISSFGDLLGNFLLRPYF